MSVGLSATTLIATSFVSVGNQWHIIGCLWIFGKMPVSFTCLCYLCVMVRKGIGFRYRVVFKVSCHCVA